MMRNRAVSILLNLSYTLFIQKHLDFSVIETSNSFPSVNVTISPNNSSSRAAYKCKKCKQVKRGHDCPFKNSIITTNDDVLEEPKESLVVPRPASNREALTWYAKRVDGNESSGKTNV